MSRALSHNSASVFVSGRRLSPLSQCDRFTPRIISPSQMQQRGWRRKGEEEEKKAGREGGMMGDKRSGMLKGVSQREGFSPA